MKTYVLNLLLDKPFVQQKIDEDRNEIYLFKKRSSFGRAGLLDLEVVRTIN